MYLPGIDCMCTYIFERGSPVTPDTLAIWQGREVVGGPKRPARPYYYTSYLMSSYIYLLYLYIYIYCLCTCQILTVFVNPDYLAG